MLVYLQKSQTTLLTWTQLNSDDDVSMQLLNEAFEQHNQQAKQTKTNQGGPNQGGLTAEGFAKKGVGRTAGPNPANIYYDLNGNLGIMDDDFIYVCKPLFFWNEVA